MGVCYKIGKGVPTDTVKAFNLFKKAAGNGIAIGYYQLAHCYSEGSGVKKNIRLALENYEKAAILKHPWAMLNLGRLYEHGPKSKINQDKAFYWYKAAADESKPQMKEAVAALGLCYLYGTGVTADYDQALLLINHAFNKGSIDVMFQLGQWFENKELQPVVGQKQKDQALECYQRIAEKIYEDHFQKFKKDEMHNFFNQIAKILFEANKTEMAAKFFELAAKQNYSESLFRIGELYSASCVSEKLSFFSNDVDVFKALKYYEKSAALGHALATSRLNERAIYCYRQACSYVQDNDFEKACHIYTRLIEQSKPGDFQNECLLGLKNAYNQCKIDKPVMYKLLKKDAKIISHLDIKLLIQSADNGEKESQYLLASHYEKESKNRISPTVSSFFAAINNHQESRDLLDKSIKYYTMAAAQGHEKADEAAAALRSTHINLSGMA